MVKHVIIWTLKPDAPKNQKYFIKIGLESLAGKIPGMIDIKVITEFLPTSSGDIMLDSTFESAEALKEYAVHPEHVKVADEIVRPFIADRKCADFEI